MLYTVRTYTLWIRYIRTNTHIWNSSLGTLGTCCGAWAVYRIELDPAAYFLTAIFSCGNRSLNIFFLVIIYLNFLLSFSGIWYIPSSLAYSKVHLANIAIYKRHQTTQMELKFKSHSIRTFQKYKPLFAYPILNLNPVLNFDNFEFELIKAAIF